MKILVANWKMNGTQNLLKECLNLWQKKPTINKVILCLPAVFLKTAYDRIKTPHFYLGGQNCYTKFDGPFTGETSACHLQEIGCQYVIAGHSERRSLFHETDVIVKEKAQIAIDSNLIPIICIGETLTRYEQNKTLEVLEQQILNSIPQTSQSVLVAYEPVWAIGTGKTPSLDKIQEIHRFLKKKLCPYTSVLYGGSVTVNNFEEILNLEEVDGLLVGGTSLNPNDFMQIIQYHA